MNTKKVKIFKGVITILVLALIIGIIVYLFPVFRELNTPEGQIAFRDKVNSSGILGLLWLFGIQVAQIFLVFVPGEPIEILAGMCYGRFLGDSVYYDFSSNYFDCHLFFS